MSDVVSLKQTSLFESHKALNARIVPFAGYEMPVQYTSVLSEAKAVREGAGMFDVSHMGRLLISGPESLEFLELVTSNDVAKLSDNTGQYSLLPNDQGGCVDDIIVYKFTEGHYRMVVNASNHEKAVSWLNKHKPASVSILDETAATSMIAVQGPTATEKLKSLSGVPALSDAPAFGILDITISGVPIQAARSGYTGEDGYELIFPAEHSAKIWSELLGCGVVPCGLGSRDTLRVEAGLPLYGHELNDTISPIAAGLGWVVSKTKKFIGSDIINQVRESGPKTRLVGIRLNIKRNVAPEMKVLVDGSVVGEVTSGIVSPLFDTALALAYVDSNIKLNTACSVEMRGKEEPGTLVSKRFFKRDS